MRILHTSDWHLGRSFHGVGLLAAQAAYVDHLLDVVRGESVDLVLVSGDIYDRALPPVSAVELADETFARLASSRAKTVVTSGNHDSPTRLGFNARLADAAGVHLRTRWQDVAVPALFDDEHGPAWSKARTYWDVAVVHADDAAGSAALDALVPSSLVL